MAIDVTQHGSAGWWMNLLAKQLNAKQPRLQILDNYAMGRPTIVGGTVNQQTVFWQFQQLARTNFAALIVGARRERLAVRAIRTAVDSDENGDQLAYGLFTKSKGDVWMSDLVRSVGVFGEGYLATALDRNEVPCFTAEDPRQTIAYCDPVTGETRAAFKMFHDFLLDMDFAVLWLPGVRHVAWKSRTLATPPQRFAQGPPPPPRVTFSPGSFDMLPFADDVAPDEVEKYPVMSERYETQEIPVERILNRDGVGEFELHTDLLDRINHMILQRVVIAVLQAFKQRGLELTEDLPEKDDQGNLIDYNDVFSADPGALWKLPPGAKIWESGEVNLQGILSAVKDDVMHLSAVTRTPLSMFMPDAVNQSAEGAANSKESLIFSVEDMQRLIGSGVCRAYSTAFKMSNDPDRADLGGLSVEWFPAARYSLSERASADSQAISLTWEQRQRIIWQQTPDQVKLAKAQRAEDAALSAAQPEPPAPPTAGAGT